MSENAVIDERRRRTPISRLVSQVLIVIVAFIIFFPFLWMMATSLKPNTEVFSSPPRLIGSSIEFSNYPEAFNYLPFGHFMLNGLIVAGLGTLVTVVSSTMAGYAFARLQFKGRDGIFLLYLGTLMVPQEAIVVPMFILMKNLGWINSYQALILPWAFTAFGTFLLRQFFLTIPRELEEAARIDGASKPRILVQILVPIARPAIGVLTVFTFITYWNSFLWPLIITTGTNMATVPLGLSLFLGQHGDQWNLLMAAATISIIPTALVVVLLQRHLVSGIARTGLGGG